ncbi:tetratricopeptide repeat protein [Streptomyces sp. Rer75]|uniref:tetratricopeptide repeat protein n=1 Tax=unclassified Streptomyces TaxID=2593676 RepID=UPI00211E00C1|nr:tetratricopeptide repeat protein [Streptomyces sp. Rer75]
MVDHPSHGTSGAAPEDTPGDHRDVAAELRAAAAAGESGAYRSYAELLTERGQLDEALPWWARAADAGDADASRTLAICHKDRGDFAEAERWYRTAADRDGGCAFGLARLLQEAGDPVGAEEWYGRGAALGSVSCTTNGAMMLAARGEWNTALERLAEASAEGDDVATRTRKVIEDLLDELAGWHDALAAAEAAGDPEAAYEALRALLDPDRQGMYDTYPHLVAEAEALYARAAAVGSVKALVDQAIFVSRDAARRDEARALVERAHELGYDGAAFVLGVWAEERGELRAAETWYRTADDADGGHFWACYNLGVLCTRQRRLDEAEEWLLSTGIDPENWDPFSESEERVIRALEDVAAIRADPARQGSAQWRDRLPGLRARARDGGPDAWYAYAEALDHIHRLPEAAEWYRKAGTPRALLALGRMLYRSGGAKGTLMVPYYEPAAGEGDASAAYDIGRIHDEAGDRRTAEIWFHRAAGLGHGGAAWWLGWTSEERGGDPQQAERWYVRAARTGLVPPAFLAGRSMVRRGAHADAVPLLHTAHDGGHAEAAYWLAKAVRGLGRPEEAERWLRTAVERHPQVLRDYGPMSRQALPDPRRELAEVLTELGRN